MQFRIEESSIVKKFYIIERMLIKIQNTVETPKVLNLMEALSEFIQFPDDNLSRYIIGSLSADCNPDETIKHLLEHLTDSSSIACAVYPLKTKLKFIENILNNNNFFTPFLLGYRDLQGRDLMMRVLIKFHYYGHDLEPQLAPVIERWIKISSGNLETRDNSGYSLTDYLMSWSKKIYKNIYLTNLDLKYAPKAHEITMLLEKKLIPFRVIEAAGVLEKLKQLDCLHALPLFVKPKVMRILKYKRNYFNVCELTLQLAEIAQLFEFSNYVLSKKDKTIFLNIIPPEKPVTKNEIKYVLESLEIRNFSEVELFLLQTLISGCDKNIVDFIVDKILAHPETLGKSLFHTFSLGLKFGGHINEHFTSIVCEYFTKTTFPYFEKHLNTKAPYLDDLQNTKVLPLKIEQYIIDNKLVLIKKLNRTLLFNNGHGITAVKLQKTKENQDKLKKQFATVKTLQKIQRNTNQLKSEIPSPIGVFELQDIHGWITKNLSQEQSQVLLDIIANKSVTAYIYTANPDYFEYITEIENDEKFIQGLGSALYDCSFLLKNYGIIFTQLIDLFHDTYEDIGSLRYNSVNRFFYPGNTPQGGMINKKQAVKYPNIRKSGLADEGDNTVISDLKIKDSFFEKNFSRFLDEESRARQEQNILYNLFGDYMLAAELIIERRTKFINKMVSSESKQFENWQSAAKQIFRVIASMISVFTEQTNEYIYNQLVTIIDLNQYASQMEKFSNKKTVSSLNAMPEKFKTLYPETELFLNENPLDLSRVNTPYPVINGYSSRMLGLLFFARSSKENRETNLTPNPFPVSLGRND